MKRLVAISVLFLTAAAVAQVHGVPASVTSTNGQYVLRAGPPASVTSLGPFGWTPPCSGVGINPAAPPCVIGPPVGVPFGTPFSGHRRHHGFRPNNGFGYPIAYPAYGGYYPYDYGSDYMQPEPPPAPQPEPASTAPAPTIFDRGGNGYATSRPAEAAAPAQEQPAERQLAGTPPEPQETVTLVFRDGKKLDITNYAIMGEMLFDLTPDHLRKKIPLSELDLPAPMKVNDDRGVEFTLPKHRA